MIPTSPIFLLISILLSFGIWSLAAKYYLKLKLDMNDETLVDNARQIKVLTSSCIVAFLVIQTYLHIQYQLSADIFIYGLLSLIVVGIGNDR